MLGYLESILDKPVFFKTMVGEHYHKNFCLEKEGNQSQTLNSYFHSPSFMTLFFKDFIFN